MKSPVEHLFGVSSPMRSAGRAPVRCLLAEALEESREQWIADAAPERSAYLVFISRIDFVSANRLLSSCATCARALCNTLSLLHSDTHGASAPIG